MLKQTVPLKRKTPLKAKKGLKTKAKLKTKTPLTVKGNNLPDDVPQWNGLKRTKLKVKVKKTPKRYSIITKNMDRCYLCSPNQRNYRDQIEIHEIYFCPYRDKSIEYGCTVPLCFKHHRGSKGVHLNEEIDLALKQKCQIEFEKIYSHEIFMEVFNKNYLSITQG